MNYTKTPPFDPDISMNDYGPPQKTGQNQPLTKEEQENYYAKLDEMVLDGIEPVY